MLIAFFHNPTELLQAHPNEPTLREPIAKALVFAGYTLNKLDRSEEAVAVYDDLIEHFGSAGELTLRELVAAALPNKGTALSKLDRSEEAIAVYDDVIERFGAASELTLRGPVAGALFSKGVALGELGRSEEAIAVYDDVIVAPAARYLFWGRVPGRRGGGRQSWRGWSPISRELRASFH